MKTSNAFFLFHILLNSGISFGFQSSSHTLHKKSFVTNPIQKNINTKLHGPFPHHHRSNSNTALSLGPAASLTLSSITAPIGSVSVLAFVILIHEAGHFLAARSMGIAVDEFSVGVGPRVTGFSRKVTSGAEQEMDETDEEEQEEGIEFNLRAIPLGGYVRFPENYNTTLEIQLERKANAKRREIATIVEQAREANGSNNGLSGVAKELGGTLLNVFTLGIVDLNKPSKEERLAALEKIASDLQQTGSKTKNNVFSFFKKPTKTKEDEGPSITIEEDGAVTVPPTDYYTNPDLLQNRSWSQRAIVLSGGVVFNILLAFSCYFGELTVGEGLPRPTFAQGAVVSSLPRENSASAGLLDRGDVILALNGQPLTSVSQPTVYASQDAISKFIADIRETTPGSSLQVTVLKEGSKKPTNIDLTPKPVKSDEASSPLSIGVMVAPNYQGKTLVKASSVGDAASKAAGEVYDLTSVTARTILGYVSSLVTGKGAPPGQSLSGPIGVIKSGSDVVSTKDVAAVVGFVAAISINLAVVNSLPLPALDGGQLVFVLAEAVTGKKIDQRAQESINAAALFLLLFVTFSTSVGDITSLAAGLR